MYKFFPVLLSGVLVACGGESGTTTSGATATQNSGTTTPTNSGTVSSTNARLLAAQCFQCHGTNGVSVTGIDSLAGMNPAEFIKEMLEMKYSTKVDIMHYQAKGYSEDEIRLMAGYFAALPKN